MSVSTAGEGIEGQLGATGRTYQKRKRNSSTSPRSRSTLPEIDAPNPGAKGPLIINLSDDDDDHEEENRIVRRRTLAELDNSVRTVAKTPNPGEDTQRWSATSVCTYTIQCNDCEKWRLVPSKEQYHAIRERFFESPWVCKDAQAWEENASCEVPTDISQDEPSIFWAVDDPSIPKPPSGFARRIVVRGERSGKFADIYYTTPCGRQLRSIPDVQRFLDKIPRYKRKGVSPSQFSFKAPKAGPNVHKRAFEKVGKIWKRVISDTERQSPQPAITAGERSRSCLSVYPNPQPLAVADPSGMPITTKTRELASFY